VYRQPRGIAGGGLYRPIARRTKAARGMTSDQRQDADSCGMPNRTKTVWSAPLTTARPYHARIGS